MSGQDPSGSESQRLEALAKQLADLEKQSAEMVAALQRSASIRRLLTLAIVALLGVFLYLFFTTGKAFYDKDNLDKLMTELQLRSDANASELMKHGKTLYDNTWPTLSAAFEKQMKDDMPKVTAMLGGERETMAVNLRSRLESLVNAHYNKALAKHRAILAETFPSIKEDRDFDLMTDNFRDAFSPLVKQYYGDRIEREFKQMYQTWDEFPEDKSKRTREELSADLYHLLFALMQHKLATAGLEEDTLKRPASTATESPETVVPDATKEDKSNGK